jgi:hypothetical protein
MNNDAWVLEVCEGNMSEAELEKLLDSVNHEINPDDEEGEEDDSESAH